jgi:hypothetical protein
MVTDKDRILRTLKNGGPENTVETIRFSKKILREMNKREHVKWRYCSPVQNFSGDFIISEKRAKTN